VERLNVEIERYKKKETEVEDNIDWTTPFTTGPKTGADSSILTALSHLCRCLMVFVPGKTVDIVGEWKGKSAGGCLNHLSWRHNPQILLQVPKNSDITITVYQQRKSDKAEMHEISVYLFRTSTPNSSTRFYLL